jgi:hypothetical protein
MPSIAAWDSADRAARAVSATLAGAGVYAVRTAYQSTALPHINRPHFGYRTLGDAGCRNRQRPARPCTGDRGHRSRPHRGSHAPRYSLMAPSGPADGPGESSLLCPLPRRRNVAIWPVARSRCPTQHSPGGDVVSEDNAMDSAGSNNEFLYGCLAGPRE